ncbi:hypothetical protein HBI56_085020 [Parastagonospora nodorum]|nr:hypothetical protein HBH53_062880 [Parastagonospora nodorum]KAH3975296.1 hypothetical protein HBH52_123980 [Parastagonospora nodorum]KAH3978469.1 hypothetical protein HBH51_060920 [Parastagonospora nodorum]KAH3999146.1 hypothetical protein HBI10_117580 [Parastagonospora nodorum]KAH4032624.1 hypothetical protein HBI09_121290 [Parastagonospora nodorum]
MVQSRQKLLEAALKGTKAQLAKTREQNVELSAQELLLIGKLRDSTDESGEEPGLQYTDDKSLLARLPDVPSHLPRISRSTTGPRSFVSLGVTPEGKVEYVPDQVQKPTGLDKPARVAKRSHSEIEQPTDNIAISSTERIILCIRARCKDYDTDTCKRQSCLRAHAEDEGSYKNLEYLPHISKYVVNTSGSKKRKTGGGLGRKKGL